MIQSISQHRNKFWVVLCGRKPGVYEDAQLAQMQVHGYPGGQIATFNSIEKAQEYMFFYYTKVYVIASYDVNTVSFQVKFDQEKDARDVKGIVDTESPRAAEILPFEKALHRISASEHYSKFLLMSENSEVLGQIENMMGNNRLPSKESGLRKIKMYLDECAVKSIEVRFMRKMVNSTKMEPAAPIGLGPRITYLDDSD